MIELPPYDAPRQEDQAGNQLSAMVGSANPDTEVTGLEGKHGSAMQSSSRNPQAEANRVRQGEGPSAHDESAGEVTSSYTARSRLNVHSSIQSQLEPSVPELRLGVRVSTQRKQLQAATVITRKRAVAVPAKVGQ